LGLAEVLLVDARHDAEERALAGAVRAEDADLRARQEGQPHALQDLLVRRVDLADVLHREDELVRHGTGETSRETPGGDRAGGQAAASSRASASSSSSVPSRRAAEPSLPSTKAVCSVRRRVVPPAAATSSIVPSDD